MNDRLSRLPRLEDYLGRCREVLRRKHYSLKTEDAYLGWIKRFLGFIQRERLEAGPEVKMERFLTHLAVDEDVAASTQNQAFNALLFLYREVLEVDLGRVNGLRAKRAGYARTAPPQEDVVRVLEAAADFGGYPTALILRMLYECGMRVGEPLNLRRKDIDFKTGQITIFEAKGQKSRVIRLPSTLLEPIRRQMRASRLHWEENEASGGPPIWLPHALRRKSATLGHSWSWWWLFPAHRPCPDPRTGDIVWWHCHERNVQRACAGAVKESGVGAWITPHVLRHACATHLIAAGVGVREVQQLLGHASLETTQGYDHSDTLRIPSPMEIRTGVASGGPVLFRALPGGERKLAA